MVRTAERRSRSPGHTERSRAAGQPASRRLRCRMSNAGHRGPRRDGDTRAQRVPVSKDKAADRASREGKPTATGRAVGGCRKTSVSRTFRATGCPARPPDGMKRTETKAAMAAADRLVAQIASGGGRSTGDSSWLRGVAPPRGPLADEVRAADVPVWAVEPELPVVMRNGPRGPFVARSSWRLR